VARLPASTVTMLFTDIEGSTALVSRLGDRYGDALSAHRALLRAAFAAWHGREMSTEGDSFFAVFESASDAVSCCVQAPGFAITAGNDADVAEICRRLDGLPLAIELAASRVRLLPPKALLTRLGHGPDLGAAEAGRPLRQQTLRNVMAWSYDLLTPGTARRVRRAAPARRVLHGRRRTGPRPAGRSGPADRPGPAGGRTRQPARRAGLVAGNPGRRPGRAG
jgi:hypothetical protein